MSDLAIRNTNSDKVKTLKDYYIENLEMSLKRIQKSYSGTVEEREALWQTLDNQINFTKNDHPSALLSKKFYEAFETNLANKDSKSLKDNRATLLNDVLPALPWRGGNEKIVSEFDAICTSALDSSIRSRATDLGLVSQNQEPKKPVEIPVVSNAANLEKISSPAQ